MSDSDRIYVSVAQVGECRICKKHKDLRIGVCFGCSEITEGMLISPGVHKLWEIGNPGNCWYYTETKQ